jgi:hypothetical protein
MPALKKADKKAEASQKAIGLDVNHRALRRKKDQAKMNKVLDKEITCQIAPTMPMPSCLPQARDGGKQADEGKENSVADEEVRAERAEEVGDAAEERKAAGAGGFWGRWSSTKMAPSASLNTGKGNRVVPRSLRDAREDAVCKVESKGRTGRYASPTLMHRLNSFERVEKRLHALVHARG